MRKILKIALCLILCFLSIADLNCLNAAEGAGLKGKLGRKRMTPEYTAPNRPVLPKKGDIAVIVEGPDPQHVSTAEARIIEMLVSRGYRVVDEAKMKRIRAAAAKAKAARLALEGNVEGILKINANYNAAATVVARVRAGQPVLNEFELYTGTSSAAIIAVTSRGTKLGGKTAQGKQVGYTPDEAEQKAVDAAVEAGMAQMF